MQYARACLLLVVLAACNRLPGWPKRVGGVQGLRVASSGHILVTARVDGHPQTFVLDTGANITSLSAKAARALAITPTAPYRINNSIPAAKGVVRELAIAGVEHENLPIAIVDMPDAIAIGADGILGLDVLGAHDLVIDLQREQLGVYPAGTLKSSAGNLTPIDIDYSRHGLILLDVAIDQNIRVPAMLDLGAPVSVLNRASGRLIGAHGAMTRASMRSGETRLGPVRVLVRDLGTFERLGMAHRPAMVLGNDVFENRVLAISYRDRVAYVTPAL